MRILLIFLGLIVFCEKKDFIQGNTFKNVSAEIFKEKLATNKGVLVDVRTPAEFAQNRLAGAINLDFYEPDFSVKLKQLSAGKTTFIYCAGGGRSTKAAAFLKEVSQAPIYNLNGGITGWQMAGFPVVK